MFPKFQLVAQPHTQEPVLNLAETVSPYLRLRHTTDAWDWLGFIYYHCCRVTIREGWQSSRRKRRQVNREIIHLTEDKGLLVRSQSK